METFENLRQPLSAERAHTPHTGVIYIDLYLRTG